jgi:nucleoside-diphosphate-sugar epimerase
VKTRPACYPDKVRCLVTGATGFIGGRLCRSLADSGHEVLAYARRAPEHKLPDGSKLALGDLADPNGLASAARGCEAIVHAAGVSDPASESKALGWTHVAGTENALNAAKAAGCRHFVYISCADVTLHDGDRSFWNEDQAPSQLLGEHARTKLAAEDLVRVYGAKGFRTTVLRPALVWGPGDFRQLRHWQAEAQRGGIRLVAGGKKLMATTHLRNLAHAVQCALGRELSSGSVYYIVDEELGLAKDFFGDLSEALGWAAPRKGGPYWLERWSTRLGISALHGSEVVRRGRSSAFDSRRAKTELGYEPVTTRADGMRELAAWFKEAGLSA